MPGFSLFLRLFRAYAFLCVLCGFARDRFRCRNPDMFSYNICCNPNAIMYRIVGRTFRFATRRVLSLGFAWIRACLSPIARSRGKAKALPYVLLPRLAAWTVTFCNLQRMISNCFFRGTIRTNTENDCNFLIPATLLSYYLLRVRVCNLKGIQKAALICTGD